MKTGEQQYLGLCKRILNSGTDIENKRTGKICRTVINHDMVYDCDGGKLPLVTTRKVNWKSAIAEMIGYLRGYIDAQQFADIGCNTWFANANENEAWMNNQYRKGENDLGLGFAYSQGRNFGVSHYDQFKNIIDKLSQGIDDRHLIMSLNNPDDYNVSCLHACQWNYTFSLLDGTLHLTACSRSSDVPLGLVFNMVQTVFLLRIVAQITGHKAGKVFHKLVNCHIYEDQIELMEAQVKRIPSHEPIFLISPDIKTLEDLETWVTLDNFDVTGYKHSPPIKYPFSV